MFDIFFAYLFLAGGIVCNKYILTSISAEFFVALRMLISGFLLMAYHWHQTEKLMYARIKQDRYTLLLIAACTTFIPSLLKAWSLKHMPASKQSLLGSVDPFITAFLVYCFFNEKLTMHKMLGMAVGFLGALLVLFSRTSSEQGYEFLGSLSYPEIAILTAVIMSRYGWILVQILLRNKHYTPIQINALVQVIAGFFSLMLAGYTRQMHVYNIASYPHFLGAFAFTVLGGNIIGYTLYAYSLKHHSATLISLAGFLIPLLVALFAYIFLGEQVTPTLVLGGCVIFLGLLIFYTGQKKSYKNS